MKKFSISSQQSASLLQRLLGLIKIDLYKQMAVNFICGAEALPKPLSADEEAIFLLKCKQGDQSAKNTLIERNLRLVVYLSKRFENTGVDIEDLVSVGTLGLIKAVGSFEIDKKIKLATYASRCIENEILMHLRKISKHKREISLDQPINEDGEGNELLFGDILGTDCDTVFKDLDSLTDKQLLNESLNKLNKREKEIMDLRFGLSGNEEKTQKEVADLLGISQSYISRLEKRIMIRLKKEIAKLL